MRRWVTLTLQLGARWLLSLGFTSIPEGADLPMLGGTWDPDG